MEKFWKSFGKVMDKYFVKFVGTLLHKLNSIPCFLILQVANCSCLHLLHLP